MVEFWRYFLSILKVTGSMNDIIHQQKDIECDMTASCKMIISNDLCCFICESRIKCMCAVVDSHFTFKLFLSMEGPNRSNLKLFSAWFTNLRIVVKIGGTLHRIQVREYLWRSQECVVQRQFQGHILSGDSTGNPGTSQKCGKSGHRNPYVKLIIVGRITFNAL